MCIYIYIYTWRSCPASAAASFGPGAFDSRLARRAADTAPPRRHAETRTCENDNHIQNYKHRRQVNIT